MEQERTDLTQFAEKIAALRQSIGRIVVGQTETVDLVLTAILADGHVLIEGKSKILKQSPLGHQEQNPAANLYAKVCL